MWKIIRGVGTLAKVSRIRTDYGAFRLHYTFTVAILLTFCFIVTTVQLAGDPITCDFDRKILSADVMNTYCWIQATFLAPEAFDKSVGDEVPHPGIDSTQDPKKFRHYNYYQWVHFILFLQAILFYIPKWLWKTWEDDKMKTLTGDFINIRFNNKKLKLKSKHLVMYVVKTWKMHDWYVGKYLLCELLSLINVIGQIFLLDEFFDGHFLSLGLDVMKFSRSPDPYVTITNATLERKDDPMIRLFPRVTKCLFRKYGRTALIETHDALCIMTLNIVNEKCYIFLWFWFIILAGITSIAFITHLFLLFFPYFRVNAMRLRLHFHEKRKLRILLRKGSFGDWFLLDLITLNLDYAILIEFFDEITEQLPIDPRMIEF